ncbi:MAG TPA: hypothetical protein DDW87_09540 [Firmicutes bacterium]|nr:hypothetical protein [Bacillota bacterium]
MPNGKNNSSPGLFDTNALPLEGCVCFMQLACASVMIGVGRQTKGRSSERLFVWQGQSKAKKGKVKRYEDG